LTRSDKKTLLFIGQRYRFKERTIPLHKNNEIIGSGEIIVFYNVLGGINRRWKARIDWRNHINGFDMFAVPEWKGKLEKI